MPAFFNTVVKWLLVVLTSGSIWGGLLSVVRRLRADIVAGVKPTKEKHLTVDHKSQIANHISHYIAYQIPGDCSYTIYDMRSMTLLIKSVFENFRNVDIERSEERRVGKECRSRWSPDH